MKETRIFAAPVEVRAAGENVVTIAGYGAVFENEYEVSGFTESIARGAFDKTLQERRDLAVVWSHDAALVLGTQESGTARFSVDSHGLRYEADIDMLDPDGIAAARKITTGKVRQSSFAFEVVKDQWEEREGGLPHRTLTEMRLWECSPVLWGANPATAVDIKSAVRRCADALGIESEAETIPDLFTIREAATSEPVPEPPQALEDSPEPEPKRVKTILAI